MTKAFYYVVTICLSVAALGGCMSMPAATDDMRPPKYTLPEPRKSAPGSIYNADTSVRLFEDLRPARVGDILTVRLVERTIASQSSSTSTSKSTSATLDNPSLGGRALSRNGDPLFGGSLSGSRTFDGEGSSAQSNSLDGDITVTVVERLTNGNLRIQGEKWLTINQGREFIRLSGIVRPYDIEGDNSVASGRVANAEITYSSKGVMAATNRMGLLARFFNSVLYPF